MCAKLERLVVEINDGAQVPASGGVNIQHNRSRAVRQRLPLGAFAQRCYPPGGNFSKFLIQGRRPRIAGEYWRLVNGYSCTIPNIPNIRDCANPRRPRILAACPGAKCPDLVIDSMGRIISSRLANGRPAEITSLSKDAEAPSKVTVRRGVFALSSSKPQSWIAAPMRKYALGEVSANSTEKPSSTKIGRKMPE